MLPNFTRGVMRAVLDQPETVVAVEVNSVSKEKTK